MNLDNSTAEILFDVLQWGSLAVFLLAAIMFVLWYVKYAKTNGGSLKRYTVYLSAIILGVAVYLGTVMLEQSYYESQLVQHQAEAAE